MLQIRFDSPASGRLTYLQVGAIRTRKAPKMVATTREGNEQVSLKPDGLPPEPGRRRRGTEDPRS
jgi:hypothetical protein